MNHNSLNIASLETFHSSFTAILGIQISIFNHEIEPPKSAKNNVKKD